MNARTGFIGPVKTDCPCCGAPMHATAASEARRALSRSPISCRIFDVLSERAGKVLSGERLAELVYRQNIDGPPDTYRQVLCQSARRMRPIIREYGWDLVSVNGRGGGYAIVALERANAD